MKKFFKHIFEKIFLQTAYFIIFIICKSLRVKALEDSSYRKMRDEGKNVIFAFWHRRLLYLGYYYQKNFGKDNIYVIVSRSRDGTRIGKIVKKMGIGYVQGSTSKGGAAGLKRLIDILKKGKDVAITPDGPRGPAKKVQMGVLKLAEISKAPIIPISYLPNKYVELRSWDKFIIPLPFTSVLVKTGKPMFVDKLDGNEEKLAKELENRLNSLE